MLPGLDPRKMNAMMSQLGIKQKEIDAEEVIIKTRDKEIRITNPSVTKINFSGQDTFQISGDVHESELTEASEISEEDIETVAKKTNTSKEKARVVLEKNQGDLAASILELSK